MSFVVLLGDSSMLVNNLWVILSALLVFSMTISVGLLEIGELGEDFDRSLMKTILITGIALLVMAIIGLNTAFAPTINGIIGNPFYAPGFFLGGLSGGQASLINTWWSGAASYFNSGLSTSTYYLFEAAFASVTFALVSVVALKKVKLKALVLFALIYFIIIWNLPAAWIWNPTGWLYIMGVRDFAGGLVVHAAAGMAGLALVLQIHREEKKMKLKESPRTAIRLNKGWLAISILLLWMGWFGFNGGSTLSFGAGALNAIVSTFLAAASSLLFMFLFKWLAFRRMPTMDYAANGILMGLIVITPLAGFVSPLSSIVLGMLGAFVYLIAEGRLNRAKWFSDPVGLFPGHMLGGIFGVLMIAFFAQGAFAAASGTSGLPNGLIFGGGLAAFWQLCLEAFAIIVVAVFVFIVSFASLLVISKIIGGITDREYYKAIRKAKP